MAKGRPRTPTAKLKSQGTFQGCRRRGEPQIDAGIPNPPTWLDKEARAEWKRVIKTLDTAGIMTKVDRGALVAYCESWSTYITAYRGVLKCGQLIMDSHGNVKKNPQAGFLTDSRAAYIKCSQEFGLTPQSRSKVQRIEKEEKDDGLEFKYFGAKKTRA